MALLPKKGNLVNLLHSVYCNIYLPAVCFATLDVALFIESSRRKIIIKLMQGGIGLKL